MLSHCLKGFREIREMIFYSLTLYHPVIYISLYIPSQLFFEHLGHHPLISGSRIFQTKWHNFVMKISNRCNERSFLLVFEGQSYLMVPLKCIKKTHSKVPKSCINKLSILGTRKRPFGHALFKFVKSMHTSHFPFFFFTTTVLANHLG